MQANDADQFRNVIRGMGKMFGAEPDALMLDMYWLALRDWKLGDFKEAAAHLLGSCKFMPKPCDFNELRKASRKTAGEAWALALECARGHTAPPDDPLITRAVGMLGGYRSIGNSHTDQTHWLEKRFAEHYESLQSAEEVRDALPRIAAQVAGPTSIAKLLDR